MFGQPTLQSTPDGSLPAFDAGLNGMVPADVLVIGGGPCGAAAATLLARQGRTVVLVEKDRHPRFHIGESLLPMSMPLLDALGVREEVERRGVIKRGADFPSQSPRGYHVFRFSESLNPTWPYAVQIRREDFDQILFDTASKAGVATVQDTLVEHVEFQDDGVVVHARTKRGEPVVYRSRYLIDASGRDALLGRLLGLKRRHKAHQSAALYAHFSGVARRDGDDAGNISIYRIADGWVWVIPLPGDVTSIGMVCGPATLRQRAADRAGFLERTLRSIPELAERIGTARMVGNLQATGNYSYECTRKAGPRWVMAGDAAAFIDPIFSSGVHVALHSATRVAELVHTVLDAPAQEKRLQKNYVAEHKAGLARVSWFILRFNTPVMRRLFANPRNDWRVQDAIISMLAGDLNRDGGIAWRLRVFKLIYFVHCLADVPAWFRGVIQLRQRRRETFASDSYTTDPS